jgi:hypothetical protein
MGAHFDIMHFYLDIKDEGPLLKKRETFNIIHHKFSM